jgi:hypothetical protein
LLPHLALVLFALLRIGEIAADNKSQSVIIQLLPALKVNIIIVHPWDVVFRGLKPSEKQHPSGEQL